MQPEQQQRITAYFIDEAKEHLSTIEQCLLNLQDTIHDSEAISEVYRAAHSLKGGAAMLGYTGIQVVSHRLEDYFKFLKESPVRSDQQLESWLRQIYGVLVEFVSQLERDRSLPDEKTQLALAAIEPIFAKLRRHLESLPAAFDSTPKPPSPAAMSTADARLTMPEQSALLLTFQSDVPAKLREMLQLFKQGESPQTRQALQDCCQSLIRVGEQFDLSLWIDLITVAQQAIADEHNSYQRLAQTVLKSIKQAQDAVVTGHADQITLPDTLKALAPTTAIAPPSVSETVLADPLSIGNGASDGASDSNAVEYSVLQQATADEFQLTAQNNTPADFVDLGLQAMSASPSHPDTFSDSLGLEDAPGPEVDIAELNILADMFEGESLDLGAGWTEDDSFGSFSGFPTDAGDAAEEDVTSADFEDLLFSHEDASDSIATPDDEIARLFGDDTLIQSDDSDADGSYDDLFGDALTDIGMGDNPLDDAPIAMDTAMGGASASAAMGLPNDDRTKDPSEGTSLDEFDIFSELDDSNSDVSLDELVLSADGLEDTFSGLNGVFDAVNEADDLQHSGQYAVEQQTSSTLNDGLADTTLVEADPYSETIVDLDTVLDSSSEELSTEVDSLNLAAGNDVLDNEWAIAASTNAEPVMEAMTELDMDTIFGEADADENLPEVSDFDLTSLNQPSFPGETLSEEPGNLSTSSDLEDLFGLDVADDEMFTAADLEQFELSLDIGEQNSMGVPQPDAPQAVTETQDDGSLATEDEWQDVDRLFAEPPTPELADAELADAEFLLFPEESELDSPDNSGLFDREGSHSVMESAVTDANDEANDMDEILNLVNLDVGEAELGEAAVPDSNASFTDDLLDLGFAEESATSSGASDISELDDLLADMNSSAGTLTDADGLSLDMADAWLTESAAIATSDASSNAVSADLDSLDALLDDRPASPQLVEQDIKQNNVELGNVVFDDLDALLDGTDAATSPPPVSAAPPSQDFADLDAMLEEPSILTPVAATKAVEHDFDDLELLLQDANRQMGGQPATLPSRTATPPRRPQKAVDPTMRVPVKQLDKLNNLVGELVVNRNSLEQDQDRLRQFLDNLLYQVQQLSDVGQRMRDLYERSLLESSLLASRQAYQTGSKLGSGSTAHSTGADFDALEMDRFTAFHSLSQEMIELIVRVRESASDIEYIIQEPMDQVTRNFRQVTTQLQEELNRARMVPFSMTADRLHRGVRDNAIKEGKQAELVVDGRDTLIDKMILEQLTDPLTHLVNNAIAHGIERPDIRQANGKSPVGRVTVRAFHQGNQTVILVSDDGAGINPEFIKKKAIEKGLVTPAEAKNMTRSEVYEILFLPGFSGAEKLTDLAGRGVGMDVVRTTLNEIRGTITIDSSMGKGTTFTIRLPLTLSISKALCCISNRARIAFPMDGVEDMFDVPRDRVQTNAEGQPCIPWRDMVLPFQPLSDVLKFNRFLGRGSVYGGGQEDDIIPIVVLRSAGNFTALQVDQVMGEQEIVIKQLQGPIPKPIGIAGATVLGDGRIMPIADVLELIDLSLGRLQPDKTWDTEEAVPEPEDAPHEPTVLIVDDSITVRELLSMTFTKVGFRVEQARDGQDAWEKLRSGLPCDIVFCDIEMPRMDGLELLSRIQKDTTLNHLPIAMLTSRGADRHRQMAVQMGARGYFTKPYLEEVLLDAAQRMLKGEVLVTAAS